jgi:L-iditol 2-dehydrogenase
MTMASTKSKRRAPRVAVAAQTGLRRIEVIDAEMPQPGPGEVLIELTAVGICGSDLHWFRMGRIGSLAIQYPQILGHEPAGIVAGVGKGVRGFKEGQGVVVEPGISCGTCRPCRQGRANLCYRVRFLGSPGFTGAFQQYLVMPASCVAHLPPKVDPPLASAAEPLGVALHAMNLVRLRRGESVAVIGGGPIGLSVVALARARRAKVVVLSDPRAIRRGVAERLGAASCVEPSAFIETAREATGGLGVSVVFECSGAPDAIDQAVRACERGGRVGVLGITEVDHVTLDPHEWRGRELEIVEVRRSNHTMPRVLRYLTRGDLGLHPAGFFSSTVGLSGTQEAFERLDDGASGEVKIVVDPRRL